MTEWRYTTAADVETASYLAGLNECFPGWGHQPMFDWVFARTVAGCPPDLIVVSENGCAVAGSGLVYRQAQCVESESIRVAIMTASWTLSCARGRGLFSATIERSLTLARERNAAVLLAFVRADNASCRRLRAAAATMIPTFYLRCRRGTSPHIVNSPGLASMSPAWAGFTYTDPEWRGQFIERPAPTRVVQTECWRAIVESRPGVERVLTLSVETPTVLPHALQRLAGDAIACGGELTWFTTRPDVAAVAEEAGFDSSSGFLAMLATGPNQNATLDWNLQDGDRM